MSSTPSDTDVMIGEPSERTVQDVLQVPIYPPLAEVFNSDPCFETFVFDQNSPLPEKIQAYKIWIERVAGHRNGAKVRPWGRTFFTKHCGQRMHKLQIVALSGTASIHGVDIIAVCPICLFTKWSSW